MFEIIALIILSKRISSKAKGKGYEKTAKYIGWLLGFWFLGEITGSIIGLMILGNQNLLEIMLCALFGASIGAVLAFAKVDKLPVVNKFSDNEKIEDR